MCTSCSSRWAGCLTICLCPWAMERFILACIWRSTSWKRRGFCRAVRRSGLCRAKTAPPFCAPLKRGKDSPADVTPAPTMAERYCHRQAGAQGRVFCSLMRKHFGDRVVGIPEKGDFARTAGSGRERLFCRAHDGGNLCRLSGLPKGGTGAGPESVAAVRGGAQVTGQMIYRLAEKLHRMVKKRRHSRRFCLLEETGDYPGTRSLMTRSVVLSAKIVIELVAPGVPGEEFQQYLERCLSMSRIFCRNSLSVRCSSAGAFSRQRRILLSSSA